MSVPELMSLVLNLAPSERAELMGALLDSLDAADPNDSDQDSVQEASRRSHELDSGSVTAVGEDEFWKSVQAGRGR